uniref:Reverse transcriptase zinc-binding domain-containing protein n=2 Tax=Quercus TaxID=3511 RepID=A0A7N2M437_QUELO
MSIPLPISPKSDRLIWALNSKGLFLVKSASRISVDQEPNPSQAEVPWKKLWKARLPERIKMLIWRIGNSSLPTSENLSCRLEYIDPNCTLCKNGWESCVPLFFECPIARALWLSSCWGLRVDTSMLQTNEDIIKLIIEPPTSTISAHDQWLITLNMALILDEIWSFVLGADVARYALLSKLKLLPFNGQLSLQAENSGTRFCWVRRLCNSAAHAVAKFSLSSHQSFFFNNGILPPDIESVCKDFAIPVVLVENSGRCNKNESDEKVLPNGTAWIPHLVKTITEVVLNGSQSIVVDKKLIEGPNPNERGKFLIPLIFALQYFFVIKPIERAIKNDIAKESRPSWEMRDTGVGSRKF